jgi:hypothetical protein
VQCLPPAAAQLTGLDLPQSALPQGTGQPNNNGGVYPAEYCAVARATMSYATGWGWDDEPCETPHLMICRARRGCPPARRLLALVLAAKRRDAGGLRCSLSCVSMPQPPGASRLST